MSARLPLMPVGPVLLAALLATGALAQGPVPYPVNPDWRSYQTGVATGGAFADLDNDGDLDLIVANGNDILRQRVEVYDNPGNGVFAKNPDWQSSDIDYHGHLSVGDVDQDGWVDVAVSVFLGPGGFSDRGHVKLYRNDGTGRLGSAPAWRSADDSYTFSCDLGDADGDGDLDLAVATGEPYGGARPRNRIYYNQGGTLESTPSWMSATGDIAMDVTFGDADGDGDLDLAFTLTGGGNEIYYQGPSGMATSPGWVSTDSSKQFGNTLFFKDVDGDGHRELAVTDNNQLGGGAGRFKLYDNQAGVLDTTPFWSVYGGYVSGIALADLHRDGSPDVAAGVWFGDSRVYLNDAGSISTTPDWQSAPSSVVEAIFFGDVNGDGLRTVMAESHAGDGVRRTFYVDQAPLHQVREVRADGVILQPTEYSVDAEDGWVALDRAPVTSVEVDYLYSESLDVGMTNWDQNRGNFVYLRAPLVDLAAVPPPSTDLKEGDPLDFGFTLTSTVNRSQQAFTAGLLALPGGGVLFLDLGLKSLTPFENKAIQYSFTIPSGLPPGLKGTYLFAAFCLVGDHMQQDSFPFTIR